MFHTAGKRAALAGVLAFLIAAASAPAAECPPTPRDALGPFYVPGAPLRSSVGEGYVLSGTVRSAADCAPVAGARVEFWMVGPDGEYGDAYRATVISGPIGSYRFESNIPSGYGGRPPHIHVRVSAEAYAVLATQHYPQAGHRAATFDLVLVPAP